MERLFTEDEANALLPQLTGLLSELRDAHAKVIAISPPRAHAKATDFPCSGIGTRRRSTSRTIKLWTGRRGR